MADKTIVITGLGVVSALGVGWQELWEAIKAGKNAVAPITRFPTDDLNVRIAAMVSDDFDAEAYVSKKELRRIDRHSIFGIAAAKMAINDAAIDMEKEDPTRIGCLIGTSVGGIGNFESQVRLFDDKGPNKISPFFICSFIPNMTSGLVSIELGLQGPNFSVASACATGSHSIAVAADMLRLGRADVIVAGGTEAPITPIAMAGFSALRALSTNNDDYTHASRPFDAKRNGFVIGEGAGVMVLETLEHALARKAHIYGILAGSACTEDAYHITAPEPNGQGAQNAMRLALKDAGLPLESVDYINAHGTSTPAGDIAETRAIKGLFGDYAQKIAVSSSKSMIGHALGASGCIESIITVLSVLHNVAPPTINYENPDPECDLDYVPNVARKMTINVALKNSFGFGGQNSVMVFKKYQGEGAYPVTEG